MKFALPAFALAWAALASAQEEVRIERAFFGGGLYLRSKTCAALVPQLNAIAAWTSRASGGPPRVRVGEIPLEKRHFGRGCEAQVENLMPQMIADVVDRRAGSDGPNCMNVGLVSVGFAGQFRYVSERELRLWIESGLCQERKPGEAPSAGDIVIIREREAGGEVQEVHGFVWVSRELVLTKNGYARQKEYKFVPASEVLDHYGLKGAPEKCRMTEGSGKGCQAWATAYWCAPWPEYLTRADPVLSVDSKAAERRFVALEARVSLAQLPGARGVPMRDETVRELRELQELAETRAKELDETDVWQSTDHFHWKSIAVRAESLLMQVHVGEMEYRMEPK